jgi:hypothetical protein
MPAGAMPLETSLYRAAGRVAFEGLAEAAAEAGAAGFVHRELAGRQQAHVAHREHRALGVRVEGLDALDLVVEEVDAVGQGGAHREEVHQPAAHAVFARRHHLGDVGVAGHGHLAAQAVHVELAALLEEEGVGRQEGRRRQPVEGRGGRHQGDVGLAAADRVERREALGDQVLVGREAVVGQGLPVGQQVGGEAGASQAISSDRRWASSGLAVMTTSMRLPAWRASWAIARASAEPARAGRSRRWPGRAWAKETRTGAGMGGAGWGGHADLLREGETTKS